MEDVLESILGYRTLPASKAQKLHHLSHTPPEYWTAKERILSGKSRTRWLHEERKRASQGGNPAILDRIWPIGPYWPNGGVLPGGEKASRQFRKEVGRMRYRDQAVRIAFPSIYLPTSSILIINVGWHLAPKSPVQPSKAITLPPNHN
jgi:hypothetical protein